MSDYTKTTNFTAKDSLTTGDPNKVVSGAEIDAEFDAIETASATKADLASPEFTGTPAPASDATSDLGLSSKRWKDIYLSGNVYLGGTSAANALDDYEEGTWTPTIQDSSLSDSESQAYTTQSGFYTKIGRMVHISGIVTTSSIGTLTGGDAVNIGGLPFVAANETNYRGGITGVAAAGLSVTAGYNVHGSIVQNQQYIRLNVFDSAAGTTALTVTEWSANGSLTFFGSYMV